METLFEYLIATVIMVVAFWFCYMSFHVVEEQKQQKWIPLPWEKDGFLNKTYHKIFDKSDVKYTDGDNT
jgi:hypothetical protein